ncbi:Conserved_hypothetical protein [Hexamita inflata]|uniref:Uncharacterized protein n=1 Tax=Hexamita inflata TaxID=28002 RepID=A0ABP1KH42_9EUKA
MEKTTISVVISDAKSLSGDLTHVCYSIILYDPENYANIYYRSPPHLISIYDSQPKDFELPVATAGFAIEPDIEFQFVCNQDIMSLYQQEVIDITGKPQYLNTEDISLTFQTTFRKEQVSEIQKFIQLPKIIVGLESKCFSLYAIQIDADYQIRRELVRNTTTKLWETEQSLAIAARDEITISLLASPIDLVHLTQYHKIAQFKIRAQDIDPNAPQVVKFDLDPLQLHDTYGSYVNMLNQVLGMATSFGTERIKFNKTIKERIPEVFTRYFEQLADIQCPYLKQMNLQYEDNDECDEHYSYIQKFLNYRDAMSDEAPIEIGQLHFCLQVMRTPDIKIDNKKDLQRRILNLREALENENICRFFCPDGKDIDKELIFQFQFADKEILESIDLETQVLNDVLQLRKTKDCCQSLVHDGMPVGNRLYEYLQMPYFGMQSQEITKEANMLLYDFHTGQLLFKQSLPQFKLTDMFAETQSSLTFNDQSEQVEIHFSSFNPDADPIKERLDCIKDRHDLEIKIIRSAPTTYKTTVRDCQCMYSQKAAQFEPYEAEFELKEIDCDAEPYCVKDANELRCEMIKRCRFDEKFFGRDFFVLKKQEQFNKEYFDEFNLAGQNTDPVVTSGILFLQQNQAFPKQFATIKPQNIQAIYLGLKLDVKAVREFKFDQGAKLIGSNGKVLTDLGKLLTKKSKAKDNGELELGSGQNINLNNCYYHGVKIVTDPAQLKAVDLVEQVLKIENRDFQLMELDDKDGNKIVQPYVIRDVSKVVDFIGKFVLDLKDAFINGKQVPLDTDLSIDMEGFLVSNGEKLANIKELTNKDGQKLMGGEKVSQTTFKVMVDGTLTSPDGAKIGKLDNLFINGQPVSPVQVTPFIALTYKVVGFQLFKGQQMVCNLQDITTKEGEKAVPEKFFQVKQLKVSIDGYLVENNQKLIKLVDSKLNGEPVLAGRTISPINALKYKIENGNLIAPDGVNLGKIADFTDAEGNKILK